jgi:hypothetical protein
MKHLHTPLVSLLTIGALVAGLPSLSAQNSRNSDPNSKPTVITPPAVNNGSTWSRAPFPAARPFDDTKAPDGQAIDNIPPNTPATNTEPPVPPAPIAVLQPATPTYPAGAIAVITPEQVLTPTGRSTVAISSSMDATTYVPTIHAASFATRDQVIADIDNRVKNSEAGLTTVRGTLNEMSADGRRAFNAAADDVKDKAKALRKSIDKARKAKDADWDNARAQLAADYEAYAAALARIDAFGGAAPANR